MLSYTLLTGLYSASLFINNLPEKDVVAVKTLENNHFPVRLCTKELKDRDGRV